MNGSKPMDQKQQKLQAIAAFKDWSNYMLLTSVAAFGWVAQSAGGVGHPPSAMVVIEVVSLAASVIFAILTLAVVPLVTERINDSTQSIFGIKAHFKLVYLWVECPIKLKWVCWWQHLFFIAAIILHAYNFYSSH